tara:strand:- start:810 stop:968 length:159 start_codon:yes stop_codon:yes gene_type:complete
MKKDKEIKFLEKEIKILKEKCMDIFNPNMMDDLEKLIFKRKQITYMKKNNLK